MLQCDIGKFSMALCSVCISSFSRPCPKSVFSSASSLRLSLPSPPAEKEPPSMGERSIYK